MLFLNKVFIYLKKKMRRAWRMHMVKHVAELNTPEDNDSMPNRTSCRGDVLIWVEIEAGTIYFTEGAFAANMRAGSVVTWR